MSNLIEKKCKACSLDAPHATAKEKKEYLSIIPQWRIIIENDTEKLQREFKFKNFKEALAFTNQIGEIAEDEAHHPDITIRYGSVSVIWYTHKINGLHVNDFIMAAKTDTLY